MPTFERFCGTAGGDAKPVPALDLRPEGTLNATERVQSPYAWFTSQKCKDQVGRAGAGGWAGRVSGGRLGGASGGSSRGRMMRASGKGVCRAAPGLV